MYAYGGRARWPTAPQGFQSTTRYDLRIAIRIGARQNRRVV